MNYPELTEEEIELLADYGTHDVRDELLPSDAIREASAFTSSAGTRGVFLTGADTGSGQDKPQSTADADAFPEDLPSLIAMPLDVFLLRTIEPTSASQPLTAPSISLLPHTLAKEQSEKEKTSGSGRSSLVGNVASDRDVDGKGVGSGVDQGYSNENDDDSALRQLEEMIAEADAEIDSLKRGDFHYKPDGSEGRRLAAVMFDIVDENIRRSPTPPLLPAADARTRCKDEVNSDGEDVADPFASLPPAAFEDLSQEEILTPQEVRDIEAEAEKRIAAYASKTARDNTYEPLFEGETDASIQRRIEASHKDEDLRRKRAVFTEMAVKSVRETAAKIVEKKELVPSYVLAKAAEVLENDLENEEQFNGDIINSDNNEENGTNKPLLTATQEGGETTTRESRKPNPTQLLLDRLLPTSATIPMNSTCGVLGTKINETDVTVGNAGMSSNQDQQINKRDFQEGASSPSTTVEKGTKQGLGKLSTKLRAWLLEREAAERSAMRKEDDAATRRHRAEAAKVINDKKAQQSLEAAEDLGRREVLGEEGLGRADLMRRADKQKAQILEWTRHMEARARAKAADDVGAEEEAVREAMIADWSRAVEDFMFQKQQHVAVIEQQMTMRKVLVSSADTAHLNLVSEEADEWEDLLTQHCREESREALRMADRAAEARRRAMEEESKAFEEKRIYVEALVEKSLEHVLRLVDVEGLRATAEDAGRRVLLNRRRHGGATTGAASLLSSSGRVGTPPPARSNNNNNNNNANAHQPSGDDKNLLADGDGCLNAETLRRILAPAFALLFADTSSSSSMPVSHAHARPPPNPSMLFRTVSLALEHLSKIEPKSLAQLSVPPAPPVARAVQKKRKSSAPNTNPNDPLSSLGSTGDYGVMQRPSSSTSAMARLRGLDGSARLQQVCPMVHHLDLSHNNLSEIDFDIFLGEVFSSLRRLVLAGNGLRSLQSGGLNLRDDRNHRVQSGGHGEAGSGETCTWQQYPRLVQLDVSANKLSSLEGVQRFSFLVQLVAYGNNIEVLPTDIAVRCPMLSVLEISRNKIVDLEPLSGLRFLQSLDCGRNNVSSLEPIAHLPLLQYLYASHNNIEDLPREDCWIFLQHLFIGDNKLTHLNGLASCPMLTVLHAESNKLVDIEGIRCCRLLKTTALAFNSLSSVEALLSLGYLVVNTKGTRPQELSSGDDDEKKKQKRDGLRRLSFNDNPLMVGVEGGGAGLAVSVALLLCPYLDEINNDPVTPEMRQRALSSYSEDQISATILPWRTVRGKQRALLEKEEQEGGQKQYGQGEVAPNGLTLVLITPLLAMLSREYTAVTMHYSKSFGRAAMYEGKLQNVLRSSAVSNDAANGPQPPLLHKNSNPIWTTFRDSSEAFVNQYIGTALLLTRHYQILARLVSLGHSSLAAAEPLFVGSLLYASFAEDPSRPPRSLRDGLDDVQERESSAASFSHGGPRRTSSGVHNHHHHQNSSHSLVSLAGIERSAKGIVGRFLLKCARVKKAKTELAHLKTTSTMYSDKATKIQALFRGYRVRKALRGMVDDDDDLSAFTKVDFGEDNNKRIGGLGEVMRNALVNRGAAPVFEVREGSLAPGIALLSSNVGLPTAQALAGNIGAARLGSAPNVTGAQHATGGSGFQQPASLRPSSQPLRSTAVPLQPSLPRARQPIGVDRDGGTAPLSSTSTLRVGEGKGEEEDAPPPQDEWSLAMRQHMHKKNAKVAKQQAETMRREFVNDPLRARQMKK